MGLRSRGEHEEARREGAGDGEGARDVCAGTESGTGYSPPRGAVHVGWAIWLPPSLARRHPVRTSPQAPRGGEVSEKVPTNAKQHTAVWLDGNVAHWLLE